MYFSTFLSDDLKYNFSRAYIKIKIVFLYKMLMFYKIPRLSKVLIVTGISIHIPIKKKGKA